MAEGIKNINQKISSFKRKYYLNLLTRGVILAPAFALGYFLVAVLLEYNLWLGKPARFLLFILFVSLVVFCVLYFFKKPILWWMYKKGLGEEESAKIIGNHFPSVADKLLNIIQLLSSAEKNDLLNASIDQKSGLLQNVSFEKAVDLSLNKLYLRYLLVPLAVILILTFVDSNIFTKSTGRIVQFNQEFSPQAPFQFGITNKTLTAFFNEDFTLGISLRGDAIPESAYLISDNQRWKIEDLGIGKFQYVFEKLQHPIKFQIEASGFYSPSYQIELTNRPEVSQIKISLAFPSYTGKNPEVITNAGNIEIPEGTRVNWSIKTAYASHAQINFTTGGAKPMVQSDDHLFSFGKNFNNNDQYSISLENESSNNKDRISYTIDVIKDEYPQISVENLKDSVLYRTILLGGQLKDDYGISELRLIYMINQEDAQSKKHFIEIPIPHGRTQQNFCHSWSIDSLHLQAGDKLSYYFEVWDNDGVNGRKSTRSASYLFSLPSKDDLKLDIANQQNSTENKIDKSVQKAKEIKESINEAQQKLRGKQSLDWQDKKMLEELLKQKEKLDKTINDLQQENLLNDTKELTGEKPDKTDKSNKEKSDQKTEKESPASKEKKTNEDLAKEQNELQKDLKKFEESIEDLKKLGDELDKEEDTPGKEDFDQLENSEQQSKESLDQNNPKQSVEPQKKSLNKMKQMQKQLQQSQSSMQMEMS